MSPDISKLLYLHKFFRSSKVCSGNCSHRQLLNLHGHLVYDVTVSEKTYELCKLPQQRAQVVFYAYFFFQIQPQRE